jgi:hypothetical protein
VDVPDAAALAPPPETADTHSNVPGRLTSGQMNGIIRKLLGATEGHRNSLLHWAAARFGEAISHCRLNETLAVAILTHCASQMTPKMDEVEAQATIRSGIAAGKRDAINNGFTGEIKNHV